MVSVQIVFLVAALAGLILNKAYSGGLTAQLSVHRPPPVTLEKLLNRKYEFGLEEDVSFPIDLENFPVSYEILITSFSVPNNLLNTVFPTAGRPSANN